MRPAVSVLFLLLVSILSNAQSKPASSDPDSRTPVFIDEIHVTGTRSLDSRQLNEIVGPLNQIRVGGTDEIGERLRFQFQEHGYFTADVKSVSIKRLDPLASLPPVEVEAEVEEGQRFRFGTIKFTGVRALSPKELRAHFPIRTGEYFARGKVASGLEALRDAYGKLGYLDFTAVPLTELSPGNATLTLHVDIDEGRQFRMGALQFAGNSDLGEQLRPLWKLEAGQAYDASYLAEFIKENESLLPPNFHEGNSTKVARNCRDNTVTVFVELGPNHPSAPVPNDVGCDKESEKAVSPQ